MTRDDDVREGGGWSSPLEVETDWEEALDSLSASVDEGEAGGWEVELVRRRVRAALTALTDSEGREPEEVEGWAYPVDRSPRPTEWSFYPGDMPQERAGDERRATLVLLPTPPSPEGESE